MNDAYEFTEYNEWLDLLIEVNSDNQDTQHDCYGYDVCITLSEGLNGNPLEDSEGNKSRIRIPGYSSLLGNIVYIGHAYRNRDLELVSVPIYSSFKVDRNSIRTQVRKD